MAYEFDTPQKIAVLGGGPGGYEAAIAGAQLGAEVTLIERVGVGGSAVMTDVVPSKTLIATAEATNAMYVPLGRGAEGLQTIYQERLRLVQKATKLAGKQAKQAAKDARREAKAAARS